MSAENELPEREVRDLTTPLGENRSADLRKSTSHIIPVTSAVSRGGRGAGGLCRHQGALLPKENSCGAQPVPTAAAHIHILQHRLKSGRVSNQHALLQGGPF